MLESKCVRPRPQHYQLDQETLQHLALVLAAKARSVCSELRPPPAPVGEGGSAGEGDGLSEEEEGEG